MSHPTLWPKKSFFYPIGNTPPACLTSNLPPEEDAKILLLGCGDPRNILYTVTVDHGNPNRGIDITCCDLEPAIVARNVLLFTLIFDCADAEQLSIYWNIFYDLFLDQKCAQVLKAQCDKLVGYARDTEAWNASPYGRFLGFATENALKETSRHWSLYTKTIGLPKAEQKQLRQNFTSVMKDVLHRHHGMLIQPKCAAVPFSMQYPETIKTYSLYWETGTTGPPTGSNTQINPTFLFSLAGRQFNLHYGTDPCSSFHLAPALTGSTYDGIGVLTPVILNERGMWSACRAQFSRWSTVFHHRIHPAGELTGTLFLRFAIGDALAFCDALRLYKSGRLAPTVYTSAWGGSKFHFDDQAIGINPLPTSFNVIDTSNLSDHLGLLNILIATLPLLSRRPSSTLNTQFLLPHIPKTARSSVEERALLDFQTIALLLGIVPTCYAAGFTFRNNCEEALLSATSLDGRHPHGLSWKFHGPPENGERGMCNVLRDLGAIRVEEGFLADQLFSLYLDMFENENIREIMPAIQKLGFPHYHRESFARFLRLIQTTGLQVNWNQVVDHFLSRVMLDRNLITGPNNFQNLITHLYTFGMYHSIVPVHHTVGRGKFPTPFQLWKSVPPVVCVVLVVPRSALKVLEEIPTDNIGHPILECETASPTESFHNTHSSIRPIFGTVVVSELDPLSVTIREDPQGIHGNSSLTVSFHVPAWILTKDPASIRIGLCIKSTPSTAKQFMFKLGPYLEIFTAKLLDNKRVFILPDRPDNTGEMQRISGMDAPLFSGSSRDITSISKSQRPGTMILTKRLDIEAGDARDSLAHMVPVEVKQTSPFCMTVAFGEHRFPLFYPTPVDGDLSKTRIARKSSYIEIDVPFHSMPERQLLLQPFPVIVEQNGCNEPKVTAWNAPYLNLDTSPLLPFPPSPKATSWINNHVALFFSRKEIALMKRRQLPHSGADTIAEFKTSIRAILTVFFHDNFTTILLVDPKFTSSQDPRHPLPHAVILLAGLRIDLSSGAIVGDAAVIFPTDSNTPTLLRLWKSTSPGIVNTAGEEVRIWKHAFPSFAERCRKWKHLSGCEYAKCKSIPISQEYSGIPLCSCGEGKDLDPFKKEAKWKDVLKHATRIALGPIFPVTYLEEMTASEATGESVEEVIANTNITSQPDVGCNKCGESGKPKLLTCGGCQTVKYCSKGCQTADWKRHKPMCKALRKQ